MLILLRLMRKFVHNPWLTLTLGLVILGVGIAGLVTGALPHIFTIMIMIVGVLSLLRLFPRGEEAAGPPTPRDERPQP